VRLAFARHAPLDATFHSPRNLYRAVGILLSPPGSSKVSMPTHPTRLLCVGKDPALLRTRCAVLRQSGYDAQSANVPEAEILLLTEKFDLIIVSAFLDEWEKGRILAAASTMPTLVLRRLTLAPELLSEVERMLSEAL
jgi:hypothetical protein